jgi:ABC-type multidrug transport system ATPase subunit
MVGPGETYGFLGPNGAGKTTTMRMLLGLVRPDAGAIRLSGATRRTMRSQRFTMSPGSSRNLACIRT